MIYLLTVKEILILSDNIIFIHKKYNHSRQLYSDTKLYSFQGTYQFFQGNISSFDEIYSFRESISVSRKIYLFKEHIFVHVQGHRFHSRKIYLLNIVAFAE